MDIISPTEMDALVSQSQLVRVYNEEIDRESAFEILTKKLEAHEQAAKEEAEAKAEAKEEKKASNEPSTVEKVLNNSVTKIVIREVARGLLGVLGIKSSTKKKSNSWF